MAYTDKEILDNMTAHMVEGMKSKWSMSKPTYNGILKRMKKDDDFAQKVHSIEAEALAKWEQLGLDALLSGNETFNVQLFKMYAGNKKPFIDHATIEIEERLTELENEKRT